MSGDSAAITVRGELTAEELVALLAALRRNRGEPEPSGYERWRRQRLNAIRPANAEVG